MPESLHSDYDIAPDFGALYDAVPVYAARVADVQFYVEEAVAAGGPVLELGCGTGRVLLAAARAGVEIVGIDSSDAMLARCAEKLAAEPPEVRERVRLVRADARDFYLQQEFALAIAPFRIVQHMVAIDDQLRLLAAVRRHLKEDGRLRFDVFNPNWRMMVSHDGTEHEDTPRFTLPDGRTLRRTARIAKVHFVQQVSDAELVYYLAPSADAEEQRLVHAFHMRWFLPAELEHLLVRGGFRLETLHGDFTRAPLEDASPEIVVVAERA